MSAAPEEASAAYARGRDEAFVRAAELARHRHLGWRLPHPDDARDGEPCDDETCCADIASAILALRDGEDPSGPTTEFARGWRAGTERAAQATQPCCPECAIAIRALRLPEAQQ